MQNYFASQPDPGSYQNLKKRMLRRVLAAGVDDQIRAILQTAYETALAPETVILSRPERKRLYAQIVKQVLENMIEKLDDRSNPS